MLEMDAMADVFKALSDPLRLKLLEMLSRRDASQGGEICVCDLAEKLGVSQPNVSHHLKILKTAGLVRCERNAGFAYYQVNRLKIGEALSSLNEKL